MELKDGATVGIGEGCVTQSAVAAGSNNIENEVLGALNLGLSTIIGIVGIIDNMIVFITMVTSKKMRSKTANIFLMNQCCIDCACSILIFVAFNLNKNAKMSGLGGNVLCKWWFTNSPLWSMLMTSIVNLEVLTIERYFEIVHPLKKKLGARPTLFKIVIAGIWLFGPIYDLPYGIATSGLVDDGTCTVLSIWPNETTMKAYGVFNFCMKFFIPLCVVCFCYSCMLYVIIRRNRRTGAAEGGAKVVATAAANGEGGKEGVARAPTNGAKVGGARGGAFSGAMRNMFKTLLVIMVVHLTCWSFNQAIFLAFNFGYNIDYNGALFNFSVFAVYFNCCLNPIILLASYTQLRQTLLFKVRQVWRALNSDEDSGTRGGREGQKQQVSTFNMDQQLRPPQYTSTAESDGAKDVDNY